MAEDYHNQAIENAYRERSRLLAERQMAKKMAKTDEYFVPFSQWRCVTSHMIVFARIVKVYAQGHSVSKRISVRRHPHRYAQLLEKMERRDPYAKHRTEVLKSMWQIVSVEDAVMREGGMRRVGDTVWCLRNTACPGEEPLPSMEPERAILRSVALRSGSGGGDSGGAGPSGSGAGGEVASRRALRWSL